MTFVPAKITPGSLCYLVHDDHVLLLQRRRPPHVGFWSPPGGKMHPGESPEDCLIREMSEETGLLVSRPELRAVVTVLHEELAAHWLLFVYLATDYQGTLTPCDEGELRWIALDELDLMPRPAADIRIFSHVMGEASLIQLKFTYNRMEQLL